MTDLNVADGPTTWPAGTPAQRALAVKWIKRRRTSYNGKAAVWAASYALSNLAARRLSDGFVAEATDFAVAWRLCNRIASRIPSTTPIGAIR